MPPSLVVLLDRASHFTDSYFSVLADRRFEVKRVASCDDAVALVARDRANPPDMLLLNGSGRPIAETMADLARLREADADLPLVVLTLAPDPALSGRVRALGAAGVLAGPWLPRDLVAAHERAVEVRRRRREAARERAQAEAVTVRLDAEARRAADLERANARLVAELAEARAANTRIGETLKAIEARKSLLDTRQAQLRGLAELSGALVGARDAGTVVELVVREAVRLLGAEAGVLRLLDDAGATLAAAFVAGGLRAGGAVPLGEGVQGWVARTGRPLVVADAGTDARVRPADRAGKPRERLLCVPVALRDRLLGTLLLSRTGGRGPFTAVDVELLGTIAAQAAAAVARMREAESVERTYLHGLRQLVRSAERRDAVTAEHSDNVAFFAVRLARVAGLDEARTLVVRRAAWLHDLGQAFVAAPGAGRFSADERRAMLEHPTIAYHVLEPVAFLGDARAAVRDHHERFDGAGYPDGRSGDALAVETRIVAIADAFDAMTRERAYRPTLSVEQAASELRAHRGTQFDPDLVDRFVDLLDRDQHADAAAPVAAADLVVAPAGRGFAA